MLGTPRQRGTKMQEAVAMNCSCEQEVRTRWKGVHGDAYPDPVAPTGHNPKDSEKEVESGHTKVGKKRICFHLWRLNRVRDTMPPLATGGNLGDDSKTVAYSWRAKLSSGILARLLLEGND
jgi:hypothetical protein